MGFYLFFLFFSFIGIMSFLYPKQSIYTFIFSALFLPTSSAFTSLTYLNGVFVTDAFFLFLLVVVLIRISILKSLHLDLKEIFYFLIPVFIFISYLFFIFFNASFDLKIIKEFRPIILLIETIIFLIFLRQTEFRIDFYSISKLAIIASLSNIIYFLILFFGIFMPEDLYYVANTYRYLDLSTYFSIYFIIHYFIIRGEFLLRISFLIRFALFLSFISIIISNSRFLVVALFLSLILSNISNFKLLIKRVTLALLVISLLIAFSYVLEVDRVLDALDRQSVTLQLISRYLPALTDIYAMTYLQAIFGYGLGHYFDIPWFDYRDNIEGYNISVDCAYLTVYVKQGVFGLLSLILMTRLLVNVKFSKHRFALLIFWGTMFLVSASFYQIYPIGAVIYNGFLTNNEFT
ncbi:MAG: hypothetical protein CMD08_03850 [Flavobacteriales bacterium]|nr:hypothetical protein [Flavobacteriales bacterium]